MAERNPEAADIEASFRENPADDDVALIYADWLEEHGDPDRAEFLRLQVEVSRLPEGSHRDTRYFGPWSRFVGRAHDVLPEFRLLASRPAVEACGLGFEVRCGRRWDMLASSDRDDARLCDGCNLLVRYASSVVGAQHFIESGHPVVVDVCARRKNRNLSPPAHPRGDDEEVETPRLRR